MRNFRQRYRQPNGPLAARRGIGGYADTYVTMPTYIRTTDKAALDLTGDIELVARVALTDWTPSATSTIGAKWTASGNQKSYNLSVSTAGNLILYLSTDGAATLTNTSSTSAGHTDGTTYWAKVTRRQSDGRIQFFTAPDQRVEPSSFTQLGTNITGTTSALFSGSAVLEIGSQGAGSLQPLTGRLYRFIVRSGIGGTTVADFDAAAANGAASYADAYGNTWTVG